MTTSAHNPSYPHGVPCLFRAILINRLAKLTSGSIAIVDGKSTIRLGRTDGVDEEIELTVHRRRFYRRVVLGGGLGAAGALIDGDWSCSDLTALIRLFVRDLGVADSLQVGLSWPAGWLARLRAWFRKNTPGQARKNIHAHYDLGNEFFELFLDETMNYSSGLFSRPDLTMKEASVEKMRAACETLQLGPDDHLLEIGTGWGALAEFAAKQYGCRVTTTTISQRQFAYAKQRIKNAGLTDRVTVLNQDYRQLEGTFSKIVSIEMIEAVGHQYYDEFFRTCRSRLSPEGALLLQAIVIKDSRFQQHIRSVDFIREYIFPGGCLPSIGALTESASRSAEMRVLQLTDFAADYAETLRRWRSSFCEHLDRVRRMGFSESFIRMWMYYLCYCEAGFDERQVNVVQMTMGTPTSQLKPQTLSRTVSTLGAATL